MKAKNNKIILPILYTLTIMAILISIISLISVIKKNEASTEELQWKCNIAKCTQYEELSGEEWAQESCKVTNEGTLCESINELGEPIQFYLEEILKTTNLSELSATRCLEYTCIEEIPYRESNHTIETDITK